MQLCSIPNLSKRGRSETQWKCNVQTAIVMMFKKENHDICLNTLNFHQINK